MSSDQPKKNPFKSDNDISNIQSPDKEKRNLPEDVAREYECVNHHPGVHIFKNKRIDLRTITLETANHLVEAGFPHLVKKTNKATSKTQA